MRDVQQYTSFGSDIDLSGVPGGLPMYLKVITAGSGTLVISLHVDSQHDAEVVRTLTVTDNYELSGLIIHRIKIGTNCGRVEVRW